MAKREIDLAALEHLNAFTFDQFCARNNISKVALEGYIRAGIGPRVTQAKPWGLRLITRAAEKEWFENLPPPSPRPRSGFKLPGTSRGRPRKVAATEPAEAES